MRCAALPINSHKLWEYSYELLIFIGVLCRTLCTISGNCEAGAQSAGHPAETWCRELPIKSSDPLIGGSRSTLGGAARSRRCNLCQRKCSA